MADTQPQAPYGGYTGPVTFKTGRSRKFDDFRGQMEHSGYVQMLDDQGNVLDTFRTSRQYSEEDLNGAINRAKAQFQANITGVPQSVLQNYKSESVTLTPGGTPGGNYQAVTVGEDGSLTIKTLSDSGIRQAPSITTAPETVPLGTPAGSIIDTVNLLPLISSGVVPATMATAQPVPTTAAQPTYSYAAPTGQQAIGQQAMTQPQAVAGGIPSLLPQAMARPTLPYFGYTNQFSPINTLTQPGPAGAGEQLMYDQQSGTMPFSYVPR